MTAITDLTWTQLAAETPANAIALSDGTAPLTAGVYINISALTGDTVNSLSSTGVLEAMYKLRLAAGEAQATVNAAANSGAGPDDGEALAAFPPFTFSQISVEGTATVTQVSNFVLPVSFNTVLGQNV